MHAIRIPSTALTQSQVMQLAVEKTVSRFPQVAFVFSKTGTAEMASDPMPPNASDTFIILKPREAWPDPSLTKEALIEEIAKAVNLLPGNVYEFTQPIQMRFNELLAGVRGDIAVKIFGDEFERCCAPPMMWRERGVRALTSRLRARVFRCWRSRWTRQPRAAGPCVSAVQDDRRGCRWSEAGHLEGDRSSKSS